MTGELTHKKAHPHQVYSLTSIFLFRNLKGEKACFRLFGFICGFFQNLILEIPRLGGDSLNT